MGKASVIPRALREQGLFCCWRYEQAGGRKTKIPYDPRTGQRAQTNNHKTFCSFSEAVRAVQNYDGVGFLITNDLFVIDCDHCKNDDGTLKQPAADIVAMFPDCYAEWSPSGEGLHIIGRAPAFSFNKTTHLMNNRRLNVEVYISGATNRFMTLTANVYQQGGVPECGATLQQFLAKYMRRDAAVPPPAPGESCLSDVTVIQRAASAKNGSAFQRLWDGDCSGYASQSEADLALCGILAFWCGKDIAQMDCLFRQSGLFREKWDRPQAGSTYGRLTLEKAAAEVKSAYRPGKRQPQSAPKPEVDQLAKMRPENNPRYCWTDIGAGRLFADYFKAVARFAPERKQWFVYDGTRWEYDMRGRVCEFAKHLADALLSYAARLEDERQREAFLKYCVKWQKHNFRDVVLSEAESVYPVVMEEFDADLYAFNCANGTLHLDSGKFTAHDSADLLTKKSPVKYDPAVRCPRWEQFISEIMRGDEATAQFMQRAFGYALTGDTQYECMFILYGVTTRNGKGTLCESVLQVMGDYGKAVKAETIAQKRHTQSGSVANEDVARLSGVRFANISEPSRGLVLNVAQVKEMTGNDTINARFLYENSFDFRPTFKLYINTNYRPNIQDMTIFTSNRVFIIPFERHFEPSEQDTTLKRAFAKPVNQSAILNWLVAGCRQVRALDGLQPSDAVTNATQDYEHDSDRIAQFVEDVLVPEPGAEARSSDVYEHYKRWCSQNGLFHENARNFKQAMSAKAKIRRGRPRSDGNNTTLICGYALPKTNDFEQYSFFGEG
ncbi:MAG: nucleoside triphosphatase [Oscillospiraceae bacterium]|jgi:putative DNA primase/helicase|nr:nucleoside triphosphatase [Oscillospiraceae bacterium]